MYGKGISGCPLFISAFRIPNSTFLIKPYTVRPTPFLIFRIPHSAFRILNKTFHLTPCALRLFLFSAFRIPNSEFLTPYTANF